MSRFIARIAMSPDGYRWSKYEHYKPGRDDIFIFLDWTRQHSIREHYNTSGKLPEVHCYDPFVEEPALYRIFAGLEPSPEAILGFAEKYGDFTTVAQVLEGEEHHLMEYKREISAMRAAVEAADEFISASLAAKTKVVSKRLLVKINETLGTAPLYMSAVPEGERVTLRLVVDSLLDAMKLQLAEAIADRKRYRGCEFCNKPFEVTPQINRSDRVFCSDNCRVKAYQRRKKQAVELRESGRSIRAIVKATRSDLDTVKRWLATTRPQEK